MRISNFGTIPAAAPSKLQLSSLSWSEINDISQNGDASLYFSIGDEKDIVVNGETLTMQIYGFNHDTLSSDGVSKAGITFGMKNLMATKRRLNLTYNGWNGSSMRTWITGTLIGQLPSDLQSVLKTVNKLTAEGGQYKSQTIITTQDQVFLFSEIEIHGFLGYSTSGEGNEYQIFSDGASHIKKLSNGSGLNSEWWERSPKTDSSTYTCCVYSSGSAYYKTSDNSIGVCFGFCV